MADRQALANALMSEDDQAAMQPETYANPMVRKMLAQALTLPQRAIDASAQDVQHLGEPDYQRQSIAPAVETAMTMTGGAGGFPAEANTLRAGIRPYQNVPQSLMGYRSRGPQRGYGETSYPHQQPVEVTMKNGDSFVDAVEGMNPDHALERAYRNWPDAIHITPLPK
jgi:hypothetical protein